MTIAKHARGEEPKEKALSPGADSHIDAIEVPAKLDHDRSERLEALAILRKRLVENGQASLLNSHRYAPANHLCVEQLSETVRWAAEQLGMPPDRVSLHVFKQYPMSRLEKVEGDVGLAAYTPQAFVICDSGAIFINVELLEALSWSSHLVNAVLYHEVAHLQLKREIMSQIELDEDDPLRSSLETYEVEHHCDRLATLLSSRRGEDPTNIGKALAKLTEEEERIIGQSDLKTNTSDLEIPLLSTHPATVRRIRENAFIARHLPSTGFVSDSKLAAIADSDLPIKRPFGTMIDEANTLGASSDEVRQGRIEDPPMQFGDLIRLGRRKLSSDGIEARSELFSDWFAGLCGFLGAEDGEEFEHEFVEELRNSEEATKEALGEVLENINLGRLLNNHLPCDPK